MTTVIRFRGDTRCPVCGGREEDERGGGKRCHGFHSGEFAHCSREEHAGGLPQEANGTFAHRLGGPCKCGMDHGGRNAQSPPATGGKIAGWPTLDEAVRWQAAKLGLKHVRTDHYSEGFAEARFDPADGGDPKKSKSYRPFHRKGGRWFAGDPEGLLPLYKADALPGDLSTAVYVVEGPKCAAAVRALGLPATASSHGAKSARRSDWGPLAGRNVVIVPDHDGPGERFRDDVAEVVRGLSPPAKVRVLDLPGLGDGQDVVDWLAAGNDRDLLEKLAAAAPEWRPAAGNEESDDSPIPDDPWPAPLGPDAFHGLSGEIVRAIGPHTEADPAAMLVQLLAAFGNAAGPSAFIAVGGTTHHANENVCLVGRSSSARKGTSFAEVMRLLGPADVPWRDERSAGGLSSGEGLIFHVRDGMGDDPGVGDKRLLVYEPEFAGPLAALTREGNTLGPVLRQAWDRRPLGVLTRKAPLRASGAHISVIAHVTTTELADRLSGNDRSNGFGNRFLWVCCKQTRRLPFGGSLPQPDVDRFRARLAEAMAFAKQAGQITWSENARHAWAAEYDRLTSEQLGALGAIVARAAPHVLRLSLIYCLLDRQAQLGPEHVRAGLAVWRYCRDSAAVVFGSGPALGRDDQKLLDALQDAGRAGLTRTQISVDVFRKNKPGGTIAAMLGRLRGMGVVRSKVDTQTRKPTERWYAATNYEQDEFDEFDEQVGSETAPAGGANSSCSSNSYSVTAKDGPAGAFVAERDASIDAPSLPPNPRTQPEAAPCEVKPDYGATVARMPEAHQRRWRALVDADVAGGLGRENAERRAFDRVSRELRDDEAAGRIGGSDYQ